MDLTAKNLQRADRLHEIASHVGFALWQLQTLEGMTAQYFVLAAQATKGMGQQAGNLLVDKAQAGTFGATITKLRKAGKLSDELDVRFQKLLAERNWLVHNSRSTSGHAINNEAAYHTLLDRLDRLTDETASLLQEIGRLTESFVITNGVPAATIDQLTQEILERWHAGEV